MYDSGCATAAAQCGSTLTLMQRVSALAYLTWGVLTRVRM